MLQAEVIWTGIILDIRLELEEALNSSCISSQLNDLLFLLICLCFLSSSTFICFSVKVYASECSLSLILIKSMV